MPWPFSKKTSTGARANIEAGRGDLCTGRPRNGESVQALVRCPLCGKHFQRGEAQACSACAIAARCGLVMCPNCSYEFPA